MSDSRLVPSIMFIGWLGPLNNRQNLTNTSEDVHEPQSMTNDPRFIERLIRKAEKGGTLDIATIQNLAGALSTPENVVPSGRKRSQGSSG